MASHDAAVKKPVTSSRRLKQTAFPHSPEVLLLVDVINPLDFPTAQDILPSAMEAAKAIAKLKARHTRRGMSCIYANDNYGTWHSEFRDILAECCKLEGPRGEMALLLSPGPEDLVILKPQHSAFHSTPLQHLLTKMKAKKLIIVGLAADMCVMLTATDARMLGYDVWVPKDCTAAESVLRKDNALQQLEGVFKCSVRAAHRKRS
ncbi:cysteine hydrolase family protein [Comamonas endophytica]|uniref:Cysteine hydrolase n=1 Tax=Comamonas endophytica TaxID=2949090 RepID=A0ABY6G9W8_9BURK|nr:MULTISPECIES: isochorismatase family cysteine hydrolase [unclassified Acidovorax]MCD2514042.1 cysteine hydrolase [Acidovorax sp. D4N7]UYG51187.1 cysteine hydrolase [Acidovorax sp. 5MLIR]